MYLKCGAIQPEGISIKALVSLNQLLHLTKKRIRNDNASLVSEISFVGDVEIRQFHEQFVPSAVPVVSL